MAWLSKVSVTFHLRPDFFERISINISSRIDFRLPESHFPALLDRIDMSNNFFTSDKGLSHHDSNGQQQYKAQHHNKYDEQVSEERTPIDGVRVHQDRN
jgi:hypothetical protein